MIFRNKNPCGRRWIILLGLAEVVDGIVRILSFGHYSTRLPLIVSRNEAKYSIENMDKIRANINRTKGGNQSER